MLKQKRWTALTYTFVALLAAGSAQAAIITIDDFSADQAVPAGGNSFVDDAGILGGQRDVVANGAGTTFNAAGGVGTAAATGSSFVLLDYDGPDDNASGSSFLLGDIDLTGGGMNDRFFLDITSVTGSILATVRVAESLSDYSEATLSGISTAGLFELPFANLSNVGTGGNVNAAKRVFLRFNLDADEQVSITNFYVGGDSTTAPVPEPASAALLGLGLCAAALLRKRRSA